MKENKKVSVIMGIYNCENYLEESIKSILNQTYNNIELIMCEDGSSDNTYEVAQKYANLYPDKIILLKNKKNMGLNCTLNRCIEKASGYYIARQDGDDVSLNTRIEKEVNFLNENTDIALVGCDMIYFDENGEWGTSKVIANPQKTDLVKNSPFNHATCCIKKEVLDKVNGYTENKRLLRMEDYDLWFKIYANGYKGCNLKEELYKVREDKDAIKRRKFKYRINEARVRFYGYKKLKMPIIKYIYVIRPIVVGLIPNFIYKIIRRIKMKR